MYKQEKFNKILIIVQFIVNASADLSLLNGSTTGGINLHSGKYSGIALECKRSRADAGHGDRDSRWALLAGEAAFPPAVAVLRCQ